MTNHVHLLVETIKHPTHTFIRQAHSHYAIYFNKKYDYVGHLFQGRYKGQPIPDITAFLQISRYIHLNPVRANLTATPDTYKWSSYPQYLSLKPLNPILTATKIPKYFNGIEGYDKFVKAKESVASDHP
ncbi:hypothetical protein GCM10007216_14830 [Thalassobacillus devorans]|uniref:Transposase IS200-like domain-containing protein n=1 Tax=Thalassobacillus devorans TaxID=279813 RepID=A0ABQ1NXQ6_9BACI|nr:transposase [Thalassobacillus devorans]NIK28574.1 hypothetical protein [Thalassobacillus devorans]GGC85150.1 hypothetical protein GCM10007216_14830 [Thalassobacillus devorans]